MTSIITVLSLIATVGPISDARNLQPTDPLTTILNDYVYIKGDNR